MIRRLFLSISYAVLAFYGTTSVASADFADWNRDDIMLLTGAVALGLMAFLTLCYAVKWYLGWDAQPPAPEPDDHAHGHASADDAPSHAAPASAGAHH